MYKIIAFASVIVRQFYLPNPFASLGDYASLYNWIAEPFLHVITFAVVGIYYSKGKAPALGSFLYLFFYCIHVGLLMLMGSLHFAYWWIAVVAILYLATHIGVNSLKSRLTFGGY